MIGGKIAEAYVRFAFETAAMANRLERWREDLLRLSRVDPQEISAACRQMEERNEPGPAGPISECLPSVVDFACALVSRGRGHLLPDVAAAYARVLDEHYGLSHAEVVSAVPLDQDTVRMIENRLTSIAGHAFVVDARVDPSIVGGLVVRVGDRVIDRSVRARLASLRQDLLTSYEAG